MAGLFFLRARDQVNKDEWSTAGQAISDGQLIFVEMRGICVSQLISDRTLRMEGRR
jgi:hypothetical protein